MASSLDDLRPAAVLARHHFELLKDTMTQLKCRRLPLKQNEILWDEQEKILAADYCSRLISMVLSNGNHDKEARKPSRFRGHL